MKTNDLERRAPSRCRPASGSGWGLWHKVDKRWLCFWNSKRKRKYARRSDALAAMVEMTGGKRDAMTNYFRMSVAPRPLNSPNAPHEPQPPTETVRIP